MSELVPLDENDRKKAIAKVPNELQPGVAALASVVGPVFWWGADSFMVRLTQYSREFGMTKEDFLLVCRQFKRPDVQARLKRDADFLAIFADFSNRAIAFRKKREAMESARKSQEIAQAQTINEEEAESQRSQITALIQSFTSRI